jgi:hypothetical protein
MLANKLTERYGGSRSASTINLGIHLREISVPRREMGRCGWLWTRGTLTGEWIRAIAERTISRLDELLAQARNVD